MACPLCDAPTVGSRRCAACRLEAQFGLPEDSLDDERTPCSVEGCPRYGIDGDRCGWHDEDDLLPDGGEGRTGTPQDPIQYAVTGERATVSYGPNRDDEPGTWSLAAVTDDHGRVEFCLAEEAMYELWIEVQDVPWPRDGSEAGDLRREIVELTRGQDAETLRDIRDELKDDLRSDGGWPTHHSSLEEHVAAIEAATPSDGFADLVAGIYWCLDHPTNLDTDLDLIEQCLTAVLEVAATARVRYHARSALQYVWISRDRGELVTCDDPELRTDGGQDLEDTADTVPVRFETERDADRCPECGLIPTGIRTDGPDQHVLEPCGHPATMAVRRAVLERTLPEGGDDLAARLVENLEYLYLEASEGTLRWPDAACEQLAGDLRAFRAAWGIEPQTPHPAVRFDEGGGES